MNEADATGGAFTLSLPANPNNNEIHFIKKVDTTVNVVTLSGNGHNIDGVASIALGSAQEALLVQYNGTAAAWRVWAANAAAIL